MKENNRFCGRHKCRWQIALIIIACIAIAPFATQAREITSDDMRQIMQDTNCLLVEIEETKKSLALERQETDKYIALANELNYKNKKFRKACDEKRWGGIALGLVIGAGIGALATR